MNDLQHLAEPAAPSAGARQRFALFESIARLSTTRANGRIGLAADVGVGIALLGAGLWRNDVTALPALTTILSGLLLFSFIEYCFHRWLFHGIPSMLERGHSKHHEEPLGYDALPFFLPPLGLLAIAWALSWLLPLTYALLLTGALASGYASYGVSHALIHAVRFRRALPRRWAGLHHIHHFHPDSNFGVTTPLWDLLLRTRYVPRTGAASASRSE